MCAMKLNNHRYNCNVYVCIYLCWNHNKAQVKYLLRSLRDKHFFWNNSKASGKTLESKEK